MWSRPSCRFLPRLVMIVFFLLFVATVSYSAEWEPVDNSLFDVLDNPSAISPALSYSPTDDTIRYDNDTAQILYTGADYYVAVRFTTVAPYELQSIYMTVLNQFSNTTDGCTVWVVDLHSTGLPDFADGKLDSVVLSPPLAHLAWIQVDLDDPINFTTNDEFYIVYGPVPGGAYPGPGWWGIFDSDSTLGERTMISFDGYAWGTVNSGDALIRVGGQYTSEFKSDEVFVYFTSGADPGEINLLNTQIGCELIEQFAFDLGDSTVYMDWMRITSDSAVPDIIESYRIGGLSFLAEPNFARELHVRTTNNAEKWPNDPPFDDGHASFGRLWGLDNWGQRGTVDADIDAPQMWRMITKSDVIVAVLDGGVDYGHEDLSGNIWINWGDLPNGMDDDGNGYVDDFIGWDFGDDDWNPMDDVPGRVFGHGTHVAGTIGAKGNNGLGVTGVCWDVKLMPLKIFDSNDDCFVSYEIKAIDYAIRNGAKILNCSFGGRGYNYGEHLAMFTAQVHGVLVVAAAGNHGNNVPRGRPGWDIDAVNGGRLTQTEYPCSFTNPAAIPPMLGTRPPAPNPLPPLQNIIGVAASDDGDNRAGFSNWGAVSVHLAAPGDDIYSTVPGDGYDYNSGTSMATPHVAGSAALCWTLEPHLNYAQLKSEMLAAASSFNAANKEKKPGFQGLVVTDGRLRAAQNADFGDAPDPTYPTEWPPVDVDPGAIHLDCGLEWLGPNVSIERDAHNADGTDTDGRPNLVNRDGFCDAVTFWDPYFCKGEGILDSVDVVVTVSDPTTARYGGAYPGGKFLYLSSFFDFNADGDWRDVATCVTPGDAPDHLLIQAVHGDGAPSVVNPLPADEVVIDPKLWGGPPGRQSKHFTLLFYSPTVVNPPFWSRFRLEYDDKKWPADHKFLGTDNDYSLFGEVEDYYISHGWHWGYNYYYPYYYYPYYYWPYWTYPHWYYQPCQEIWFNVPWWWQCYTWPPPPNIYSFGIALDPVFTDMGWSIESVSFREYEPDATGAVQAELEPDEAVTLELNTDFDRGDGTVWQGFSIENFDLPDTTMVLYYQLTRPENTDYEYTGNVHFIAGDTIYGWSSEIYEISLEVSHYHGWHWGHSYYRPWLWPYWHYPYQYYHYWRHVRMGYPLWWSCYTWPPTPRPYYFGVAVPQGFLDQGWSLDSVGFREYAPDGDGPIQALCVPDAAISAELNADHAMGDSTVWLGYRLDGYTLPDTTMAFYYDLVHPVATECNISGNFHFIAGDSIYGWSQEMYTDVPVEVTDSVGAPDRIIRIETTEEVSPGDNVTLSITLEDYPLVMGGFDFLIEYDYTRAVFTQANAGQLFVDCEWEYFTYQFGASGLLRLTAIAETNNGPYHPSCYGPPDTGSHEVATMTFLVNDDPGFECNFIPLRFYWADCGDNAVSSVDGEISYVSDHVYGFEGTDITDPTYGFPTYFGVQDECFPGNPEDPTPVSFANFYNGGIYTICSGCCGIYTGGITGNANCSVDGKLTLSDITQMIDRVYISKTNLCCEASGNTNADLECKITLSDITKLIDAVYISKTAPELCMPQCEQ